MGLSSQALEGGFEVQEGEVEVLVEHYELILPLVASLPLLNLEASRIEQQLVAKDVATDELRVVQRVVCSSD